jgi:hypothetical protein
LGHNAEQGFFPDRVNAGKCGIEIAEVVLTFGWLQVGPIQSNCDPINIGIVENFILGW